MRLRKYQQKLDKIEKLAGVRTGEMARDRSQTGERSKKRVGRKKDRKRGKGKTKSGNKRYQRDASRGRKGKKGKLKGVLKKSQNRARDFVHRDHEIVMRDGSRGIFDESAMEDEENQDQYQTDRDFKRKSMVSKLKKKCTEVCR